jgi:hypothetical protein
MTQKVLKRVLSLLNVLLNLTSLKGVVEFDTQKLTDPANGLPAIFIRYRNAGQLYSIMLSQHHLDITLDQEKYPSLWLDSFYADEGNSPHPVLGRHINWVAGNGDGGDPTAYVAFLPGFGDPVVHFEHGVVKHVFATRAGDMHTLYGYEPPLEDLQAKLLASEAEGAKG